MDPKRSLEIFDIGLVMIAKNFSGKEIILFEEVGF